MGRFKSTNNQITKSTNQQMFGTDGVRGVANIYPMTAEMALEIGRAAAYVRQKRAKNERCAIVIGKDTRVSGDMLESALAAGICSMGADVLLTGVLPTPGIAFMTRKLDADAGIVISASHNPYMDNGIKIFSREGFKLPDAEEDEIEDIIVSGRVRDIRPTGNAVGGIRHIDGAAGDYAAFCKNTFPENHNLTGLRIALDCANGATSAIAPDVFRALGADTHVIHSAPNGTNINERCGSQHTEDLQAKVIELKADVGLAFDGDGDRLIAVDENGNRLTGDHVMAICARLYKELGLLKNNLVVATVMSNFGFFAALKSLGIRSEVSQVGDRYVFEKLCEKDAVLGGEESGHVIFLNRHTSGDGIIAALQLLWALRHYNRTLSELAGVMTLSPQKIINVDVTSKPPLSELPDAQKAILAAEAELGDAGRVLVRYSGTQAMCRVMVEGPTREMTDRLTVFIADAVRRSLG